MGKPQSLLRSAENVHFIVPPRLQQISEYLNLNPSKYPKRKEKSTKLHQKPRGNDKLNWVLEGLQNTFQSRVADNFRISHLDFGAWEPIKVGRNQAALNAAGNENSLNNCLYWLSEVQESKFWSYKLIPIIYITSTLHTISSHNAARFDGTILEYCPCACIWQPTGENWNLQILV